MKIEERAEKYGKQGCGENCIFVCKDWEDKNGICIRLSNRIELYKSIAAEQKAIDIDKACEWLMQNWNMGRAYINAQGKLCYRCIDDFRKAMEG